MQDFMDKLGKKHPIIIVASTMGFIFGVVFVVVFVSNTFTHIKHAYQSYHIYIARDCRASNCPANTRWKLGSYTTMTGYHYRYKPQNKLPTKIASLIPHYPNAQIFYLNIEAPKHDVHWITGEIFIHTPDTLDKVTSFYQNAITPTANRGDIQPSLTGIEFFEQDSFVNRLDISTHEYHGNTPFRSIYPDIPKDHHIHNITLYGKSKPLRPKPPKPPTPEEIKRHEEFLQNIAKTDKITSKLRQQAYAIQEAQRQKQNLKE